MTVPVQKHLTRLVGQFGDRPLYALVCDPSHPQKRMVRLVGNFQSRPLYVQAPCDMNTLGAGLMPTGKKLARLVGQFDGRPLYATVCCGQSSGSSGSGSTTASSSSGSLVTSASSGSSGSGSSGSGSEAVSLPGSLGSSGSSGSGSASASGSLVPSGSLPGSLPSGSASASASASGSVEGSGVSSAAGSLSPSGSGSSGSGSVAGVQTTCCPQPLPLVLYLTIPGEPIVTLNFVSCETPTSCCWNGSEVMTCGVRVYFNFCCNDGGFGLGMSCVAGGPYLQCTFGAPTFDCGPPIQFSLPGPCSPPGGCGVGCGPWEDMVVDEG